MSKVKTKISTVVKAALKELDIEVLKADPSYQRDVKAKHAKIIAEFDENALGIPLIGQRSDGSLWIVDGLQRITALRKMGKKRLRAEVFASKGPEHEANVFKLVNMNRTKLSPMEEFRALLTAHDDASWEIKNAVEAMGFKMPLGKSTSRQPEKAANEVTCINTLRKVHSKWGIEPIQFALRTVRAAWPGDPLGTYNMIVGGLATFFNRHDKVVDEERLVARLQTTTPQKVMYTAGQLVMGNLGRDQGVADVVEKVYRKRYGVGHKKGS